MFFYELYFTRNTYASQASNPDKRMKKFPYIVQPAVEAAFTRYSRHQSGRTDKAKGCFDIPTKEANAQTGWGKAIVERLKATVAERRRHKMRDPLTERGHLLNSVINRNPNLQQNQGYIQ
jgi:hypothetical protein